MFLLGLVIIIEAEDAEEPEEYRNNACGYAMSQLSGYLEIKPTKELYNEYLKQML